MHSKLPPSSAFRRVACPGSRSLETLYPSEETEASLEGTAAHWVASIFLSNVNVADLPEYAPNGIEVNQEMIDAAIMYVNEVYKKKDYELFIEVPIDISNVHPECWGTPDCFAIVGDYLYLWDFKYGHGFVDVFENWQLIEYALGIAQSYRFKHICMTIVQPRNYHKDGPIRHWELTLDKLVSYMPRLQQAENIAMSDIAYTNVGSHCKDCKARHACQALQQASLSNIDSLFLTAPHELNPQQTGQELRYLYRAQELLEARITALEEAAKHMISKGESVTGFKLESTTGREKWTRDIEEVLIMGDCLGIDLRKPQELITPTQARKLGLIDDVLINYLGRAKGALKLVPMGDAKRIFGND